MSYAEFCHTADVFKTARLLQIEFDHFARAVAPHRRRVLREKKAGRAKHNGQPRK